MELEINLGAYLPCKVNCTSRPLSFVFQSCYSKSMAPLMVSISNLPLCYT